MIADDILNRIDGVKRTSGGWSGRCPAHDDKHNSLSIAIGQDGRLLLNCHAGSTVEQITDALGLSVKDLFVSRSASGATDVIYDYKDDAGNIIAQKVRKPDKNFTWRRPDGKGGWIYNRKGVPNRLYVAGDLSEIVFVCEGEKDADNLHRLGFNAVSGADGAGKGKWKKEYTQQLKGINVYIFSDNDQIGRDYAQETAASLHNTAKSVRLLNICAVWPDIPEHGDISDLIAKCGDEKAREMIGTLIHTSTEWEEKPASEDPFLSCFKTLDNFEEEVATWLIPGWLPEGQITLMAADGGIGKTTLWCNIIAGVSSGKPCLLDPDGYARQPQKVAFLTTEDSVRKKLKTKLRLAGANMSNIITPDFLADKNGALRDLKFGSAEMEKFIKHFRPALCVFDPVQGFIPPDINMGSRNAMRDCMAPLISLGEEYGTSFLVVCHTNKRQKASGRERIADSADLWDISRSVLMAGYTEDKNIRYLSNEKNNYDKLQETLLFEIDETGQAKVTGSTWKHDRDFAQEAAFNASAPKREDCKEWILRQLDENQGDMLTRDLDASAKLAGYSDITLQRAKSELKKSGEIQYRSDGSAKDGNREWHTKRSDLFKLPDDTPTPWN